MAGSGIRTLHQGLGLKGVPGRVHRSEMARQHHIAPVTGLPLRNKGNSAGQVLAPLVRAAAGEGPHHAEESHWGRDDVGGAGPAVIQSPKALGSNPRQYLQRESPELILYHLMGILLSLRV